MEDACQAEVGQSTNVRTEENVGTTAPPAASVKLNSAQLVPNQPILKIDNIKPRWTSFSKENC